MKANAETLRGKRFLPIPWQDIPVDISQEWLVKGLLPREGLAALYGKPSTGKSFIAFNLGVCVALGEAWAGRLTRRGGVVYIAAEGAVGLRKRRAGYLVARPEMPKNIPFSLISVAPDLGTSDCDGKELIAAITRSEINPGLIIVDTLSRSLGSGDENGSGMAAFISNVGRIAEHFRCLVLIIHHTGWSADNRLRGHSSLFGALDALILCERGPETRSAQLTVQKLKDDAGDVRLVANLKRVVVGHDMDGDEISTLIVESIVPLVGNNHIRVATRKPMPKSHRLLLDCLKKEITNNGVTIQIKNGDPFLAVAVQHVRHDYFAATALQSEPGEDENRLIDRQRKGFGRALEKLIETGAVMAAEIKEETFLWIP